MPCMQCRYIKECSSLAKSKFNFLIVIDNWKGVAMVVNITMKRRIFSFSLLYSKVISKNKVSSIYISKGAHELCNGKLVLLSKKKSINWQQVKLHLVEDNLSLVKIESIRQAIIFPTPSKLRFTFLLQTVIKTLSSLVWITFSCKRKKII